MKCPGLARIWALCAVLLAHAVCRGQDLSAPGPFQAGWTQVSITRSDQSSFTARLFYPATASGHKAAFSGAAAPCPIIAFAHGYLQTVDRYQSTLEHLASRGYVVIATDSHANLLPSHSGMAQDLVHSITYVVEQNASAESFLYQQVAATEIGVCGHSMGGGCALLAASLDPRIKCVVATAPAETKPSAVAACAGLTVPACLIAGSKDTIVPVAPQTRPMYVALKGPRQLAVIQGASHCGFMDVSVAFCDSGSLPRPEQLAETRALMTGFFGLYLKRDASLRARVWTEELPAQRVQITRDEAVRPVDPPK